ncbi:DUF1002 domain-containing protein [Lentibacillus halophilus]|uniref:DUF1002 domain-containing protein n=1 Tax=Lentibacillus halophilus TaxID=295065 RepID=A0ABN0Z829_9BACI
MRLFRTIIATMVLTLFVSGVFTSGVMAANDGIDEKFGAPIVVYGDTLTNDQKQDVKNMLEVNEKGSVEEYTVTGNDIASYIDGNPDSRMFSSAKITKEKQGAGITINIVTSENITQVTNEMYANALLTAGVENATVDVASPVKVSGHSALTGIYKAYDTQGEPLDKERMELANDELDTATKLADKAGMDQEKVSELLTEIKKQIAEQNPATKEDVKQIVEEKLDELSLSLSDEHKQMLIDLFERMRDLDINFDTVKKQLDDIASKVQGLLNDDGFWNQVKSLLSKMIELIGSFLNGLFAQGQ